MMSWFLLVQSIILAITALILYLSLKESRISREQQSLPILTLRHKGGSLDSWRIALVNGGTGVALKVNFYIIHKQVKCFGEYFNYILPKTLEEIRIPLTNLSQWQEIKDGEALNVRIEYRNASNSIFVTKSYIKKECNNLPTGGTSPPFEIYRKDKILFYRREKKIL